MRDAKVVTDGPIVGLSTRILAGDEVLSNNVVVAPLLCPQDGVQDAAAEFHAPDHQSIDAQTVNQIDKVLALPHVESVFGDNVRARYGFDEEVGSP
jgi:hypothetical protein